MGLATIPELHLMAWVGYVFMVLVDTVLTLQIVEDCLQVQVSLLFHFFFNSTTDTFSLIKIAPGAYSILYSHDPPVSTPPSLTSCLEVIVTSFLHN